MQKYSEGLVNKTESALKNESYRNHATKLYNAFLESFPYGDPKIEEVQKNKNTIIEGLITQKATINHTKAYITKNGDEGLIEELKIYNDMEGLSGLWNWSDENVDLTKDIGIMVGSFILTAGAGTLFSAIANGAKFANAALVARATAIASK